MKYILTFIFCIVLSTSTSFAQTSNQSFDKIINSYLTGLNYSNPGVVESTIENIMILKLYYPEQDYSQVIQKLDELKLENVKKAIQVKAFIATNYLKNPQKFNSVKKSNQKIAIRKLLNSVESIWRV